MVTDELWEARQVRFPEHTPNTREYYLLRSMFEEHFPSPSALATVPKVPTMPALLCHQTVWRQPAGMHKRITVNLALVLPSKLRQGCSKQKGDGASHE